MSKQTCKALLYFALNGPFTQKIKKGRPYVIVQAASAIDMFTGKRDGAG